MIREIPMRVLLILISISSLYLKAEDFISRFEYGQMLYNNPRGVSCIPCHGETGEGKIIAKYRDSEGKERVLRGVDIRAVSLEDMIKAVKSGPGVMPKYFLVDDEIKAIYEYIQKVNESNETEIDDDVLSE